MHFLSKASICLLFLPFLTLATLDPTSLLYTNTANKSAFIDSLIAKMTVPEMVMQLYLFFADDTIGPNSTNELYNSALHLAPDAGIGIIQDWYTLNKSHVNNLQRLNLEKSRLKIPFLHVGECLHGVGSFQQSMFPQVIALAASWDVELVRRVGRAIGKEARAVGIHACLSPVLDVCRDGRWGRCQEDWGEDHILTSLMGVAYASGLSKDGAWSEQDAVVPVMKHFAAHGAPQSGLNAAPWMGHGNREVLQNLLVPFKAAVELGGVRGVMMAYSEVDDVPSHVSPMLYGALDEWGFDGFVIADDTGMAELESSHMVTSSPADTIAEWFNAGGMVSYYDYPLDIYMNSTIDLVRNNTVAIKTLQDKMRQILGVKYDLGLFSNPYIPESIDPQALTEHHVPLTLEAAHKSIVLLENRNNTLPLKADSQDIKKLALIGPFSDMLNYGDYAGQFGQYPVANSSTLRQGILDYLTKSNSSIELVSAWGANAWLYNGQYPIPGYHLSTLDGTVGGLKATYYADTNFSEPLVSKMEVPVRDWGLYPPEGLPSNNFSAVWEGILHVPVDIETQGWLGVGVSWNATANLYIDGTLHIHIPLTTTGNLLSNIPGYKYTQTNSTAPPPGSAPITFHPNTYHHLRLEFQSWNLHQKLANQNSLNAEILLFWNLVPPSQAQSQALHLAQSSDLILLALGASWSSDGENGDRATLALPGPQTALAEEIFSLKIPTILLLSGGRPFAIPEFYAASAAVLNTYFPGQAGGHALTDILFGESNPGGRIPLTVPRSEGQMPVFYNFKGSAHLASYVDEDPKPMYAFGYGLSYTNFSVAEFASSNETFTPMADVLVFIVLIANTGAVEGSYVMQVYLLQRVSRISQPVKQLVAFERVYLSPGEARSVRMEVDVQRYLKILNRRYEWEVERGEYTFALLENGGMGVDTGRNVTLRCV